MFSTSTPQLDCSTLQAWDTVPDELPSAELQYVMHPLTSADPMNTTETSSTLKPDGSSVSRFARTLSANAKGYFSYPTSKSEGGPITSPSHASTPGTPAVGDVIGNPTPFQRFLSLGKTRKDWEVQFPPPHWDDGGKKGSNTETSTSQGDPAIVMPEYSASPAELADPAVTDPGLAESIDPPPEPNILARRIQALLSKSSIPDTTQRSSDEPESSQAEVTHPPPQLVSDPKLITLLSSPAVMNGTLSKAGQSVWSVLDHLRAQLPGQASTSKPKEGDGKERETVPDDDSGIMVYGPLIPDSDSTVELAESELEYLDPDEVEPTVDGKPDASGKPATSRKETLQGLKDKLDSVWPFKGQAEGPSNNDSTDARVYFQPAKSKRVWIPSSDKISIQVMWWGYRIYLPPPVLEILDNKQLEGAKRAALLTTALKYALDKVPTVMIPPQARPAMRLLKACTPYLGYVGGFVAWSWGAVKAFDKGNGVTLTATWLLTVAVIPGTWEEKGLPKNVRKPVPGDASENIERTGDDSVV